MVSILIPKPVKANDTSNSSTIQFEKYYLSGQFSLNYDALAFEDSQFWLAEEIVFSEILKWGR